MKRRGEVEVAANVLKVRRIHQQLAEQRTAEAQSELAQRRSERVLAEEKLGEQTEAWRRQLSPDFFDLTLAMHFGAAILRARDALTTASDAAAVAETERAARRLELIGAIGRTDAAQALSSSAVRRAERRREEARLAETADVFARRRACR